MIQATSTAYLGLIQNMSAAKTPKNLSEGQALQVTDKAPSFDKLQLSDEAVSRGGKLNISAEIKMEAVSRDQTIGIETLESSIKHIKTSLAKADGMNLSFGDRLNFLKNEGTKWVDTIRQNDSEMFVQWLKMNEDKIRTGKPDLAGLPSDFTIQDYYSYVKEPFSAMA